MIWVTRITWKALGLSEMYGWEATPAALCRELQTLQPQTIIEGEAFSGVELSCEALERNEAKAQSVGLFLQALTVLGLPLPLYVEMSTTVAVDIDEQVKTNALFEELVGAL